MGDSQYSFSLTTFRYELVFIFKMQLLCSLRSGIDLRCVCEKNSPSGKLVQIEHALTAVGSGQTSLGIKGRFVNNK